MNCKRRDIWLKIEPLSAYSPLAPIACSRHYGLDCMFYPGHESGRVSPQEIFSASLESSWGIVAPEGLGIDCKTSFH
jgi:hypothetical protein